MHRFCVPGEISGDSLAITDAAQLHHLRDVLRLKVGDEVIVFDAAGNEYSCLIQELPAKQAVLVVKAKIGAQARVVRTTFACAIPKKGMDEIIDNLTQLGVDGIIPMETERVIVRLDDSQKATRLGRWRRIAQSAAKQSQRSSIPLVQPIAGVASVLSGSRDFDLRLIPTLAGERSPLREVLAGATARNILVLIGPEGDFTQQEVALALSAGFTPVSLGDLTLRVGTAATAVAACIRLWLTAGTPYPRAK